MAVTITVSADGCHATRTAGRSAQRHWSAPIDCRGTLEAAMTLMAAALPDSPDPEPTKLRIGAPWLQRRALRGLPVMSRRRLQHVVTQNWSRFFAFPEGPVAVALPGPSFRSPTLQEITGCAIPTATLGKAVGVLAERGYVVQTVSAHGFPGAERYRLPYPGLRPFRRKLWLASLRRLLFLAATGMLVVEIPITAVLVHSHSAVSVALDSLAPAWEALRELDREVAALAAAVDTVAAVRNASLTGLNAAMGLAAQLPPPAILTALSVSATGGVVATGVSSDSGALAVAYPHPGVLSVHTPDHAGPQPARVVFSITLPHAIR